MPSPEEDQRIQALTEAIARLQGQQEETNRRLAFIEEILGRSRAPAPKPAVSPPIESPVPPQPPAPAAHTRPQFETRMGLTWINRVGAITLVLGVGFFFKYAIDNRWIGETGRVLLGIVAGCAALGLADLLWKRDQKVFAQGISGTGIAILYLSFYAAYSFYHIVSLTPAFLSMAFTTVLAGALSLRYVAAAIAALGLFGGYATPLLLSTGVDHPWFFFSYVLLLNAGAITIARSRQWSSLEWLAFGATAYLFNGWYGTYFEPSKQVVATLFALLYYVLFASSTIRYLVQAAQFVAMLGVALLWTHNVGPYELLTLFLIAAGIDIADRRRWPGTLLVTFAGLWLSYSIWYAGSPRSLGAIVLFLTGAFLMFLAWTPWRLLIRRRTFTREHFLLLPLNASAYFAAIYSLLHEEHHAYLGPIAAALAAVHEGLALRLRDIESAEKWLCAGVGSAFLTLAVPIQFSGFRITMAWALEAAAIAWIGVRTASRLIVYAACVVYGLALIRLASFDTRIYSSPDSYAAIFNLRFLTFVTVAVSLWGCAYWVRAGGVCLASYLLGHFVMLWGLILEVLGWAARTSAPENLQSVESASISILMALYAVLLVTGGVLTRTAVNRIGGLALIGAVVAKLYLYDVWLLVRIYRVAAFAALGALLLLTSYLYSRYRSSIENWWSDRP